MSSRPCWAYTKKYSHRKNCTADSSCSHAPAWECYGGGKIMCGMDSHGGPWEPETGCFVANPRRTEVGTFAGKGESLCLG